MPTAVPEPSSPLGEVPIASEDPDPAITTAQNAPPEGVRADETTSIQGAGADEDVMMNLSNDAVNLHEALVSITSLESNHG